MIRRWSWSPCLCLSCLRGVCNAVTLVICSPLGSTATTPPQGDFSHVWPDSSEPRIALSCVDSHPLAVHCRRKFRSEDFAEDAARLERAWGEPSSSFARLASGRSLPPSSSLHPTAVLTNFLMSVRKKEHTQQPYITHPTPHTQHA